MISYNCDIEIDIEYIRMQVVRLEPSGTKSAILDISIEARFH